MNQITTTKTEKRNVPLRLLFVALWFIGIYFFVHIIVGAIVGSTAATGSGDFASGYGSGAKASDFFYEKYRVLVEIFSLSIATIVLWAAKLPGTSEFVHTDAGSARDFRAAVRESPVILRSLLAVVAAVAASSVWGGVAGMFNAPSILTVAGILVIIIGVMNFFFSQD